MEQLFLPATLDVPHDAALLMRKYYDEGILKDPALRIGEILANDFALDVRAKYGPLEISHPIGKGSGQLSLQTRQVQTDAEADVAFVILKTVIAEGPDGSASMDAWKIRKPRMIVEPIEGRRVDRKGWTVSWAGRGWEGSLQSYLEFMNAALKIGVESSMPVIPSCKYHLPSNEAENFLTQEYSHTTREFITVWEKFFASEPLVVEQDFSPTLAGTDSASSKRLILKWLNESPALIKAASEGEIILGVKLMNALFEDEFQLEMMETVSRGNNPTDFIVYSNRLFDPERPFEERKGIAFGGPDLSDRNLSILRRARAHTKLERRLPISATGDITSGRIMIEYALRGATSGQLHTYFQLPLESYHLKNVSRSRAALHELYFHPTDGIVAAMCHLRHRLRGNAGTFAFLDLARMELDAQQLKAIA